MAMKWIAQEPTREIWNERSGKLFVVDVLDDNGELVCEVFGSTAHIAELRAARVERRVAE